MNPDPDFLAALERVQAEDADVLEALADGPDVHGCDGCDDPGCGFDRVGTLDPVRLDPELWKPPLQWHPPTDHAAEDIYREYRAANRPFRRAFQGGEMRRKVLMAVGHRNAERKEAQS